MINQLQNTATVTYGASPVTYTVTITNVSLSALNNLPFGDILPAGSQHALGSFTDNGSAATPTVAGNTLTYTTPTIAPAGVDTLTF